MDRGSCFFLYQKYQMIFRYFLSASGNFFVISGCSSMNFFASSLLVRPSALVTNEFIPINDAAQANRLMTASFDLSRSRSIFSFILLPYISLYIVLFAVSSLTELYLLSSMAIRSQVASCPSSVCSNDDSHNISVSSIDQAGHTPA